MIFINIIPCYSNDSNRPYFRTTLLRTCPLNKSGEYNGDLFRFDSLWQHL